VRSALQIDGLDRPYRLFFVPPVSGVPTLKESAAGALAETLSTSAKFGELFDVGGSALESAGQFGELFSLVTDGVAFYNGRQNMGKVKRLLGAG